MSGMEGLGRLAVACKRWRWMPGMLDSCGDRVLTVDGDEVTVDRLDFVTHGYDAHEEHGKWYASEETWHHPDLDDPATLGCLLALVREAWGCDVCIVEMSYSRRLGGTLEVWRGQEMLFRSDLYVSIAVRRVAALEAAP